MRVKLPICGMGLDVGLKTIKEYLSILHDIFSALVAFDGQSIRREFVHFF